MDKSISTHMKSEGKDPPGKIATHDIPGPKSAEVRKDAPQDRKEARDLHPLHPDSQSVILVHKQGQSNAATVNNPSAANTPESRTTLEDKSGLRPLSEKKPVPSAEMDQ
jgi:hypothetical protein